MGDAKLRAAAAVHEALTELGVEALGGQVQVRWNTGQAATPFGQMAYVAEFLNLTGLYRRGVERNRCGSVAVRIGVATRVRVHRHSRDRIQLACSAGNATFDASHIAASAVFRFVGDEFAIDRAIASFTGSRNAA